MTLLFFLRSPAGNTDIGAAASGEGVYWDPKESLTEQRAARKAKNKKEKELRRLMNQSLVAGFEEAAKKQRKKRKDEELLMMLFMHEFDGYDD